MLITHLLSISVLLCTLIACINNNKTHESKLVIPENNQDSSNIVESPDSHKSQPKNISNNKIKYKSETYESGAKDFYFVNEKGNRHGECLTKYSGDYIGGYSLYCDGLQLFYVKCLGKFVLVDENENFKGKDTGYFTEYDTLYKMIMYARKEFKIQSHYCFIKNLEDFNKRLKSVLN